MMNVRIEFLDEYTLLKKKGLDKGGRVQKFIDSEVLRFCEVYAPSDQGDMQNSAIRATDIGSGEIVYNAPQARYLYYGKLMVSPSTGSSYANKGERKVLANPSKALKYNNAPQRGSFWFERVKELHIKDILKSALKVAEK